MSIKPIWFIIFISLSSLSWAEEYIFKQPRDARIQVNSISLPWLVDVDFIAVKCFDANKNDSINRSKAENYVKYALMKKLNVSLGESIQLQQIRRIKGDNVADRFQASFEISKVPQVIKSKPNDKNITKSTNDSPKEISSSQNQSDLLARKQDTLDTIEALVKFSHMQFPIAPQSHSSKEESHVFFTSIADFEDKTISDFESLKKEVQSDKLLLSNERKEVLEQLNSEKSKLLKELAAHAQKVIHES